jgi:zinc transport system permease protein
MLEAITYLQLPFVQRAVFAGILFAALAGILGIFTLMRRSAFFGDALAHSALAGVALGLFFKLPPLPVAFVYAFLMALLLPWLKTRTRLSFDTLLGIFLPFSMGLGVIIFSFLPGSQPDLISFLFGSVLTTTWFDFVLLSVLVVFAAVCIKLFFHRFVLLSLDHDYAKLLKLPISKLDFLYHFLLALTVIAGVRLVGVILVNALLVIVPSMVKLHARSMRSMFIYAPLAGMFTVLLGIGLSFQFNLPSGAMIAVTAGLLFGVSFVLSKLRTSR